jgi:hypothetical protein
MQRAFARVALELGWGPWRVGPPKPHRLLWTRRAAWDPASKDDQIYYWLFSPEGELWYVMNSKDQTVMITSSKALAELVAQLPLMFDRSQTETPKHLEE